MPPKKKPVRKSSTVRRKVSTSKPAVKKTASTTARKTVKKPVKKVEQNFDTIIQTVRRDLQGQKVHVIEAPYGFHMIARTLGVKWHSGLKVFLYEGGVLPPTLAGFATQDFSFNRWVEDELNGSVKTIQPPASPMTPRPHQKTAIKKILSSARAGWRGFILADNVGVGKSLSAIIGASAVAHEKGFTERNQAKLLIVAPKSVIPHWHNTIKASGVKNLRILVINYEQLKKLLSVPASAQEAVKTRTKNKRVSLHGNPTIQWDIIIGDEAHKLKNDGSQRRNAFNRIARYAEAVDKAPFVIWASATIGQNPLELGYLAPLVSQIAGGKPIAVSQWGAWLMSQGFLVSETKGGSYTWLNVKKEHSAAQKEEIRLRQEKDVKKLSSMLFSDKSPSIRRNPEDIAGWPTQTFVPVPIFLDSVQKSHYMEAWNEFRKSMSLAPRGKNPIGGLAATLRFQQKASLITAESTVDFVDDMVDNGLQIAVSVKFIESLDYIKEKLEDKGRRVVEFSGRNEETREAERLEFQRGNADVILFTVEEGISLHANEQLPTGEKASSTTRALVIHDMRHSSIQTSQILGRTTRDGELAIAYFMYAEGTIESQILNVMLHRMKNLRHLSGDDAEVVQTIHDLLDGIETLSIAKK